jgi:hypothetical protein
MIIIGTVAGSVGRPASSMVRAIAAGMNTLAILTPAGPTSNAASSAVAGLVRWTRWKPRRMRCRSDWLRRSAVGGRIINSPN